MQLGEKFSSIFAVWVGEKRVKYGERMNIVELIWGRIVLDAYAE